MRKPLTLSKLKKKAWGLCSEFIRRKYADVDGNGVCVCCGIKKHWKNLQAGHLVPSRRLGILFDERGIFPCCYGCNIMKGGNIHEYINFMQESFGRDYTDNLIQDLRTNARKTIKYSRSDYGDLIKLYEDKLLRLGL